MHEKRDRDDEIGDEELHAFEPVRFAVLYYNVHNEDGQKNGDELKGVENKVHLVLEEVADKDERGCDKHRDLHRAADRDLDREVHFVLAGHHHRGRVLGCIADDRENDDADEEVCPAEVRRDRLDATNEDIAHPDDKKRRTEEHHNTFPQAPCTFRFADALDIKFLVRVKREEQVRNVDDDEACGDEDRK